MSCGGVEVFVKFSRLFVKIHKWVLVKMSMNCKLSGTNGRVSESSKIKETLHGSNSVNTWWKKLLLFLLVVALTMGSFWFFLSSDNGNSRSKYNTSLDSCEENLFRHFNVSKNQLGALVTLLSESDQITSLQCSKEADSEVPKSYNIACVLKVLYSEKHEFGEDDQSKDQCPVDDNKILRKIDQILSDKYASLSDKYASFVSQSSVTSASQDCAHNVAQIRETKDCTECWKIASLGLPKECWWLPIGMLVCCVLYCFHTKFSSKQKQNDDQLQLEASPQQHLLQLKQQQLSRSPSKGMWMKKMLVLFVFSGILLSAWLYWDMNEKNTLRREETLSNMCDERARMLQDQFNVSMNHVQALAILVSTFHHGKDPSAIDQETFGKYTERTAFERPLTSGVAYALKVPHSEREQFEKQHGTIKKMQIEDQTLVQDCSPEKLDPAPIQEEYAPVIFSQETVSHIVSIDMMSGKEDRENILRARATGKGVLTSPFKLLKSNHLGVVLTFAVYNADLPSNATPEERIAATMGYLGASYDVPSLVEKLLHQLASKQTIVVNVYDMTNLSAPILMYGGDFNDTGLLRVSHLDFGDPMRKHEMHCRFKLKAPLHWTAINTSAGILIITLLIGHIFHAAINRIAKVEEDCCKMMELKVRAEAADVAKSQFLATVSHEIRTPMNGVLGMLKMLMNTELDATQMDYAETAHASGKDLIAIINEVLDQAKIESGRLELEAVPFDLRSVLDSVLSIFSGKSLEKQIELAIYVSDLVPEVVIGDSVRFRQIVTNLVGNSMKFTVKGHIFVSVHLADEVSSTVGVRDTVLKQSLNLVKDTLDNVYHTLSGEPVVDRRKSWESFKKLGDTEQHEMIRLLVTVEDTGDGIPEDAQKRIFMPFMQADSSTSRRYGGTGIGLSISSRLVGLMDGEIGFNSKCGTGTTFSFTACFRKGEPISLETKEQLSDPSMLEFQGRRALVIDNRIIRAEVARYHLQRLGISAYTASSLKSLSSEQLSSSLADLAVILIDKDAWDKETEIAFKQFVKGPKQNGESRNGQNLPKAFLLANRVRSDERDRFKSNGVDDILIKPLRLSVMFTSFQEALTGGKKRQENRKKPATLQTLLRGKRILVVDDNPVNRKVAEGVLKRYGAIVTTVDSGKSALIKLKPPHTFDACFMDFQMPEMDGFEATRRIRAIEAEVNKQIASGEASKEMFGNVPHWHTPILAMTADVIQATSEGCLKCGMDGYVSKPFEEEQLYEAVAQFFEDV